MKSNRRDFIKQGGALVSAGAFPILSNLAAIGEASAATATDYKALVCIFLTGGNDSYNALIPMFDSDHKIYRESRPSFHIRREAAQYGEYVSNDVPHPPRDIGAAPIPSAGDVAGLQFSFEPLRAPSQMSLATMGVHQNPQNHNVFGLSPSLSSLWPLYQEGVLAPVLNVGSLIEPTTAVRDDATGKLTYVKPLTSATTVAALTPPKLGSHNDHQMFWQSLTVEGGTQGWGGLMMSFTSPQNGTAGQKVESMFTAGNQVWSQGNHGAAYQMGLGLSLSSRFDTLDLGYKGIPLSNSITPVMQGVDGTAWGAYGYSRLHPLRKDLMNVARNEFSLRTSLSTLNRLAGDTVYAPLTALAEPTNSTLPSDANPLAAQLRSVAHTIRKNASLPGVPKRQVFFVSLGGFDTHSNTVGTHDKLLQHVAQAMLAFHRTLSDPAINAANQVVTFTASEFGRTLNANGDGTDHGWGAHHFVMGGAVKGGTVWGMPPPLGDLAKNFRYRTTVGPDTYADNGRGRLIPTISVDQYGATLAKWMGVPDASLPSIFKNLVKFPVKTMPFL